MKVIRFLLIGIIMFGAINLYSCKKDDTVGKGEIKGYAVSGSKTLKPAIFYIKYGALSSPGTDTKIYDKNNSSDVDGKFDFKGLVNGDYFIYAIGTDNGVTVTGGIHVILVPDEIKDNVIITVAP